jgi:hypothetical protein
LIIFICHVLRHCTFKLSPIQRRVTVGDSQRPEQKGCSHSLVRRRGEVEWGRDGVVLAWTKMNPLGHKTGPCRPATALPIPSVGDSASPWMRTKARSKRSTVIRLCGDGVRWNGAGSGRFGIDEVNANEPKDRGPFHCF